jgi:hypothetical protein
MIWQGQAPRQFVNNFLFSLAVPLFFLIDRLPRYWPASYIFFVLFWDAFFSQTLFLGKSEHRERSSYRPQIIRGASSSIYAGGTVGGDQHHRHADGPPLARRAASPRGRPAEHVHQQTCGSWRSP